MRCLKQTQVSISLHSKLRSNLTTEIIPGIATVLMLKLLNRRLSSEENVIQVVLMMSSAYLGHFVSEVLCGCSGIIATLTSGITIKVLGDRIINDG